MQLAQVIRFDGKRVEVQLAGGQKVDGILNKDASFTGSVKVGSWVVALEHIAAIRQEGLDELKDELEKRPKKSSK